MAQNFDDFGIFGTVFYQRKNELEEVKAFQVFFVKLDVCGDSVAFGGLEFFLQVIDAGGGTVVFKQAVQLFFQFADIRFRGGLFKGYGGRGCFFRLFGLMSKNSRTGMANSSTGIKYCVMDNNRFNTASHFLVWMVRMFRAV